MQVLETNRLILRHQTTDDAPFLLELMNEPSWLRYIGDRGVRTVDDARNYILRGALAMYDRHGFGLYLTALKADGTPLGLCGLIKRDTLEDVDIGFAFLPKHWNQGYAFESAAAVLEYAHAVLGLKRVVAITTQDNTSSGKLLVKIGMRLEKMVVLAGDKEELKLYAINFDTPPL